MICTTTRSPILMIAILFVVGHTNISVSGAETRPNIFFFFADDWGRYASIYSDPDTPSLNDVIKTPNIDRIGREGIVLENAFVPVLPVAHAGHHWQPGGISGTVAVVLFSTARPATGRDKKIPFLQ